MRSWIGRLSLSLALAAITLAPARADLTLTAAGGTVQAGGGTLEIPVYISSNASDSLGEYTLVFNIVPSSANPVTPVSSLEFVGPASSAADPTLHNTSYVYYGLDTSVSPAVPNSFDVSIDTTFGTATTGPGGFYTHFAGADIYNGSDPSGGVTIPGTPTFTVATLVVTFSAASVTNPAGDVFQILLDTAHSSFQDGGGSPLTLASPTSSNPLLATVTVQAQGVPEPATLPLTLLGLALARAIAVRRRGPAPCSPEAE